MNYNEYWQYRLSLWDGDLNGAIRYYKTIKDARREASKYINRIYRKYGGIGIHPYAEIYGFNKDYKLYKIEEIN